VCQRVTPRWLNRYTSSRKREGVRKGRKGVRQYHKAPRVTKST